MHFIRVLTYVVLPTNSLFVGLATYSVMAFETSTLEYLAKLVTFMKLFVTDAIRDHHLKRLEVAVRSFAKTKRSKSPLDDFKR